MSREDNTKIVSEVAALTEQEIDAFFDEFLLDKPEYADDEDMKEILRKAIAYIVTNPDTFVEVMQTHDEFPDAAGKEALHVFVNQIMRKILSKDRNGGGAG